MVHALDKLPLYDLARAVRVQRSIQDKLGLLKRWQLMIVAKKLEEPKISWQVRFVLPRNGYGQEHLDYAVAALRACCHNQHRIPTMHGSPEAKSSLYAIFKRG